MMAQESESHTLIIPAEKVEVVVTDDARVKKIGEAFSDDTSRRIVERILEGASSALEVSRALNVSLPLVAYHLERLLEVGLIRVSAVKPSRKGRPMRIYSPLAVAILILPARLVRTHGLHAVLRTVVAAMGEKLLLLSGFVLLTLLTHSIISNTIFRGEFVTSGPIPLKDLLLLAETFIAGLTTIATHSLLKSRRLRNRRRKSPGKGE